MRFDPFEKLPFKDFAPRILPALDPDWRDKAACRGMGNDAEGISLWFPGPGGAQEGKKICRDCRVVRECEVYSEEENIEWGIWGGEIKRRKNRSDAT